LKDKIALVTGASSGIGAATAELLAREGAVVAAVARRVDRLDALVRRIEAAGGRAAAFPADIAIDAEATAVAERVLARYGRIDILVNSAGIVRPGAVETSDPAHWREMIDINLLAAMYLSRAVLPGMRERGDGHIVIVSSTAGRYVGTRHSGYTASKHAVNAFAETMRQGWHRSASASPSSSPARPRPRSPQAYRIPKTELYWPSTSRRKGPCGRRTSAARSCSPSGSRPMSTCARFGSHRQRRCAVGTRS